MKFDKRLLFTAADIRRRVDELAAQISADYAGRDLLLIAVLKGGLIFAADLMRALTVPVSIDFIGARSYSGTESSELHFTYLPAMPLAQRHVLVVEDIVDTGKTAVRIIERLLREQPASLSVCALLDKPSRRETPLSARYVGFTIDNQFVVGYGLDYEEHGRELPDIHTVEVTPQ